MTIYICIIRNIEGHDEIKHVFSHDRQDLAEMWLSGVKDGYCSTAEILEVELEP